MREMLFRGKRTDNGQWVQSGSVGRSQYDDETYVYYIGSGQMALTERSDTRNIISTCTLEECLFYEVDPATVGQYTGLKDKNGNLIFEGDIVEGHCHSAWRHDLQRCEVAYGRDGFEARHHVNCGDEMRYFTYRVLFSKDVVVIGNIYDNPELLEG